MNQEIKNNEGVPSGFPSLDKITGGWQDSNLIIITSRPSVGKTAFAMNIALNAAIEYDIPVAFFSLEMSARQFGQRLLVLATEQTGSASWTNLEERLKEFADAPLFVDDTPGLKIEDFKEKAKKLVEEKGVRLIVIDYLQLMCGPEELKGQRAEEVAFITRSLKATAKELDIPIIALSQLSRTSLKKRPELGDLRDSGEIEQDADLVIMLHRPDYIGLTENPKEKEECSLFIAKNRNGETGELSMLFISSTLSFQESDDPFKAPVEKESQQKAAIQSRLNPNYSFDNFEVVEGNAEAVAAAKEFVESIGEYSATPLLLIGGYGSGKTHLVNALVNAVQKQHPELNVLYVSANDFKDQYMDAVMSNRISDFRKFYGKIDLLIMDSFQDLLGSGAQDNFFHIMYSIQQQGKRLVITTVLNLCELEDLFSDRLLEHITWGRIVEIDKI